MSIPFWFMCDIDSPMCGCEKSNWFQMAVPATNGRSRVWRRYDSWYIRCHVPEWSKRSGSSAFTRRSLPDPYSLTKMTSSGFAAWRRSSVRPYPSNSPPYHPL